jgi:hypothetical protein
MMKKLILVELNEINFDFISKYKKKNLFCFFNKDFFLNLKSTKSENKYKLLEPWIQWVSIHTGKRFKDHKIFRLGDIVGLKKYRQIFEIVESRGYKVGAISLMNTNNNLKKSKYFIPDPWTKTSCSGNYWIKLVYDSISRVVNNNANNQITLKDYFILFFNLIINLRVKSFPRYLYLIIKSFKLKYCKALILDLILHDLHINLLNKHKVDFSSVFFNSAAHIQHHYFFNSKVYDGKFSNPSWYLSKEHDPILESAIFYDKLLYEYSKLDDYKIIVTTGLSQVPYDRSKFYYRLKNHSEFLKECKIEFKKVYPRMTRDFLVIFSNFEQKINAIKILKNINILNNCRVFEFDSKKSRKLSIFVTLTVPFEIEENFYLYLNKNVKVNLYKYVSFVALKNGMHSSRGFFYTNFEFNSIKLKDDFNITKIFDIIDLIFKKKNEKVFN